MEANSPSSMSRERLAQAWRSASIPIAAILLAALIGAIILVISGQNPIEAYGALIRGSFGSERAFGRTLEKATPLIFGGLAVAFAFKGGLFNIGGQGQLIMGAIVAAALGFGITGLPFIIHMPLALLGGALVGALYAAIAGVLRAYTGAHEVITTIMLNFIAINITDFLANGPWKDEGIVARTPAILDTAAIPVAGNIPVGFLIAVVVVLIIWYVLFRTTLGFEIRTIGLNPDAAHYAGIRVARMTVMTIGISGFLAGMGGAIESLGVVGRFQPGFNIGLGFDGITIALLARLNPLAVIPSAILIGAMQAGSSQMQFDAGVPFEIIDVIQALILLFVSAEMIVRWLLRIRGDKGSTVTLSRGWGQ